MDERRCAADDVVLGGAGVDTGVVGEVEFGGVVDAHAGTSDEHDVVDVESFTLRRVADDGGAVAVADDGVVGAVAGVGGTQAFLEVAQVVGRVPGVVVVACLAEVLRCVVADPGDGGGVAVAGLPVRLVENELAAFEFATDAGEVGSGAGHGGDDVVCGVGIAERDDAAAVALGGEVEQVRARPGVAGFGFEPFVDGVQPAQRVLDTVEFAVLVLGAVVTEFVEFVAPGGEFRVFLGEADAVGAVSVGGGDAVETADHVAVGVDGGLLLHRGEAVPPLSDLLRRRVVAGQVGGVQDVAFADGFEFQSRGRGQCLRECRGRHLVGLGDGGQHGPDGVGQLLCGVAVACLLLVAAPVEQATGVGADLTGVGVEREGAVGVDGFDHVVDGALGPGDHVGEVAQCRWDPLDVLGGGVVGGTDVLEVRAGGVGGPTVPAVEAADRGFDVAGGGGEFLGQPGPRLREVVEGRRVGVTQVAEGNHGASLRGTQRRKGVEHGLLHGAVAVGAVLEQPARHRGALAQILDLVLPGSGEGFRLARRGEALVGPVVSGDAPGEFRLRLAGRVGELDERLAGRHEAVEIDTVAVHVPLQSVIVSRGC